MGNIDDFGGTREEKAVLLAEHAGASVLSLLGERGVARFWSKVDRSGDCWMWMGGKCPRGYGKFQITTGHRPGSGKPTQIHVRAPRLALAIATGSWPELSVLHGCDNPSCVNPEHLREGTQAENIADMDARGRRPRGFARPSIRGDGHWTKRRPEAVKRGDAWRAARGLQARSNEVSHATQSKLFEEGEGEG